MTSHEHSMHGLHWAPAIAATLCLSLSGHAFGDEVHPDGVFVNRGGVAIPLTALRFAEAGWKRGRDQGFAVALQRGTDYFYLWAAKPGGEGLRGRPLCDGHLTDATGNKVAVDDLRSFTLAD